MIIYLRNIIFIKI